MTLNSPINLFMVPAANKNNKYLDLLSRSLRETNPRLKIYALRKDSFLALIPYFGSSETRSAKNIIHIHWSTALYGSRFLLKSLFLLGLNTAILISAKYLFGFKIVWTVHNFAAHDYPHPVIDILGRRVLIGLTDGIIVQQQSTLEAFRERYPQKNIHYVPHGNYIDAYGPLVEQDIALRRALGFKDDDIVLISLGAIAPYKQNEKIIRAVIVAREKVPQLKLLVIGKGNESFVESLRKQIPNQDIVIQNKFIPDEDLPRYLFIADYSIFYYDQSEMTSGGMILSLSYGVPVIVCKIPAAEIVTDANGYIFSTEEELLNLLREIRPASAEYEKHSIIESMRIFSWQNSAQRLQALYKTV